jgi:pyruvate kinase
MPGDSPQELLIELQRVRDHVSAEGQRILARWEPRLNRAAFEAGATNLAHYLAFRALDLRTLQKILATYGLSALGRSEARVMPTLDAVIANLKLICGDPGTPVPRPTADDFLNGTRELARHSEALLGPVVDGRETRIMVTFAPKAAKNAETVRRMFDAGMTTARINCAHDGPAVWSKMIETIRSVADQVGRRCPILMDLQGPKIRTRTVLTPEDGPEVEAGDRILLAFDAPEPKRDFPFQANCAMPDVLHEVKAGARVSIKDGLIVGEVEEVTADGLVVQVTRTPPGGQPLESEKGINFPGTALNVSPITDEDLRDLDFVAAHADMVGYSFVQRPEDLARLQNEIASRRPDDRPLGIIAKIETELAFANLPDLIVQGAGANPFGVMIARGDLAVEIGYERLSEVQEEILWVCEAAYIPVIWATQVLESLVKRGMPSRGEFTDAAMGNRAECVMLNKGPYIEEGIAVLDNVLRRMERHQLKKSPQLRALSAWAGLH